MCGLSLKVTCWWVGSFTASGLSAASQNHSSANPAKFGFVAQEAKNLFVRVPQNRGVGHEATSDEVKVIKTMKIHRRHRFAFPCALVYRA